MADRLTAQEFAAKIRAKYPGEYDHISDEDLTQRVLKKYPEYGPHIDLSTVTPKTQFEQERDPSTYRGKAATAASDILGTLTGPFRTLKDVAGNMGGRHPMQSVHQAEQGVQQIEQLRQEADDRKASGRSMTYRIAAPAIQAVTGADVPGMEHDADIGNAAGILGHAIGAAAPAAAIPLVHEAGARIKAPTSVGVRRMMDSVALGDESPARILTRAMKPPVTYPEFEDVAAKRLPEMIDHAKSTGNGISSVKDFSRTADELKAKKGTQYENLKSPHIGTPLDATPIADAQVHSIPATDLLENPGIVGKTKAIADAYRPTKQIVPSGKILDEFGKPYQESYEIPGDPKTLGQLDDIREDTNAKLNAFYQKTGGDQHAALSNPETARIKAVNDTTRNLVYDKLHKLTGEDPRPIQDAFGDYNDLGNVSGKRGTVFSRQNPIPLQQAMNVGEAIQSKSPTQLILSKILKRYGDSDYLTGAAVDRQAPEIRGPSTAPIAAPGTGPNRFTLTLGAKKRLDEQDDQSQ